VSWASPHALWILGLLPPLLLLHLLRATRRRQAVSAHWLWREALGETAAPHRWHRLRPSLPLVLQAFCILALAVAAAGPRLADGDGLAPRMIVVLDVSASMSTQEPGAGSRLMLAKAAIRREVAALPGDARLMLLEAGRDARILTPLDQDRERFFSALDDVRVLQQEGNVTRALGLATDRLRRWGARASILLATDGAFAHRPSLQGEVPIRTVRVGGAQDNIGIVHIIAKNRLTQPSKDSATIDVLVRIKNFGTHQRRVSATLFQHHVVAKLSTRTQTLGPGEEVGVVLPFDGTDADRGTGLVVELSPGDAFAADDRAFALVPERRTQRVVLSPGGRSPWLRRALLADPEVELSTLRREELESSAGVPGALHVYAGWCPTAPPDGPLLVIAPPAGKCFNANIGAELLEPRITAFRESDPRLRFVTLSEVVVEQARRLEVSPEHIVINSRRGPLLADLQVPGHGATVVGFEFGNSNWPLQASFVLFVRNLVEQARAERLDAPGGGVQAGTPVRLQLPSDVKQATLHLPDGSQHNLKVNLGSVVLPTLQDPGIYHVSWQGQQASSRRVVVNLSSAAESDLRAVPLPRTPPNTRHPAPSELREEQAGGNWGWLLAGLALLVLLIEITHFSNLSVPGWLRWHSPFREPSR
jgi:hypothetical protein